MGHGIHSALPTILSFGQSIQMFDFGWYNTLRSFLAQRAISIKTLSIMSSRLVDILRQIPPAGSAGFEGLIAQLLEALTGRRFSLALSGSQAGRDMSSREPSANMIAVECK